MSMEDYNFAKAREAWATPVKIVQYNCLCGRSMKFESEHGVIAPQRTWQGLTDEEENALIPDPDGSSEANVRRVEVLPGAWGKEYEEVDAWSKPLVLQMLRNHEAKLKEKNGL
jgi:hypothetical protein